VAFDVELALWQTPWFRVGVIAAVTLTCIGLYRFRVRQLTRQLKVRFEERMYERNRIACELHDTLLQTIQAGKLVADYTLNERGLGPADNLEMRGALVKLSTWLAQALEEGRAALNSLRTQPLVRRSLAEDFREAAAGVSLLNSIDIVVTVTGEHRELHPLVNDEVYRIGYEAIHNACRHSKGSRVEVELGYGRDFVLRVLDNGMGIDPQLIDHGKAGHFGLLIMRERAQRIHGRLSIVSSVASGTEIKLIVPGRVGFSESRSDNTPLALESIDR
jgi:signal transduction histidine kinase